MADRPATLEDENVFEVAIEESTSCKVFLEQRRQTQMEKQITLALSCPSWSVFIGG